MNLLHSRCVAIVSDGSKALSGSQDGSFKVWDLDTSPHLKQKRGHLKCVTDIAVTRDGSRCVSASMDGTFKIWQCETAEECFTLKGISELPI
jgi:WD40 repeat protein